jgi:hypothetical protein
LSTWLIVPWSFWNKVFIPISRFCKWSTIFSFFSKHRICTCVSKNECFDFPQI